MEKACRVALSVNLQPTDPSALGALQKCLAVSKKAWCGAYSFSICWDWSVAVFHSLFFFILDHVKVSTQELHTILYVDCAKLGVLNQSEINMVGSVAEKVLSQNPSRPLDHWLALQYAWSNFACCKNINAKYSILQIHAYSHKKKQIWGSVLVLIPPLLVGAEAGGCLRHDFRPWGCEVSVKNWNFIVFFGIMNIFLKQNSPSCEEIGRQTISGESGA